MINTHQVEQPLSRIYFHGSKGVRAIEVLLYKVVAKVTYQVTNIGGHTTGLLLPMSDF